MEGKKMNNSQNKNLLTEGSIWKKLMGFAFPLFLGNLFQQLYNTADSLIVGNFLGSDALATRLSRWWISPASKWRAATSTPSLSISTG